MVKTGLYYTGIGSRDISESDLYKIEKISQIISEYEMICVSGNADGADITWQNNAFDHLAILPWDKFNFEHNIPDNFYVPKVTLQAKESLKFHPDPKKLSDGAKQMMIRNYYQIFPRGKYKTTFVLYCADEVGTDVKGGTGQAVRIARYHNIPVFNVRQNTIDDFIRWFEPIRNHLF